ncbi:hypothetical protein CHF27_011100 [Romboutsia maritimum]|uniref:Uncharacterized protein n=1 Tax=Romboutsia maritimum TaxID=2020948 RepID=A0A371IQU6_9FIRM|nr:hypothetical protein [Romboutsia maritimum]RDY22860.1 hypothetical protein CHF27_011100 [Romboutsia maritimum]
MKWTDEKIEREIKNVIKTLNIDRMPSTSEIKKATNNYGLGIKITRSGGVRYWADKLGLELKNSETKFGNEWEFNMKKELEGKGYIVEKMSTKHPYDLLVNDNIKIDVKVSRYYHKDNFKFYSFNLEKKYHNCDIFIFVGLKDGKEEIERLFIIPSKYLMGIKQLSIGTQSKYDKYQNRWDYIEKYSEFYAETI